MQEDENSQARLIEQNVFLIFNRQVVPLKKEITRLGRQLDNDMVFHEDFVSRFHAEIHYESDKFVLYDKQSTSGTFVNSKKIDRCVLNSGDIISLSNLHIMFVNNNPKLVNKARGTTQTLSPDKLNN